MSFNTGNNQITNTGFAYDAAGDMTADGAHTYTFDAEGNVTQIDGGATATFTYDAENERVRRDIPGKASNEYIFNAFGQRASVWDATDGWASKEEAYWGSMAGGAPMFLDAPVATTKGAPSLTRSLRQGWAGPQLRVRQRV